VIVVADTTPLNYLVLIDEIEILAALYDGVLIPRSVHRELQHSRTPSPVFLWAANLPPWCEVRDATAATDVALLELDSGEREAIQLALDLGVDTLLLDESQGRQEAIRRNLNVLGTLAVLEIAAQRGWLDFRAALHKLEQTNFRLSGRVRNEFLSRNP
jgi:predicted nucleic acid-binding protein